MLLLRTGAAVQRRYYGYKGRKVRYLMSVGTVLKIAVHCSAVARYIRLDKCHFHIDPASCSNQSLDDRRHSEFRAVFLFLLLYLPPSLLKVPV